MEITPDNNQDTPKEPPALLWHELSDKVFNFLRRYFVLSRAQADTLTLWVIHTHAIEAAEYTPYILINSPEPQCGKSLLEECLSLLVYKPWYTSEPTSAALRRKISQEQPTLLLDESDAAFNRDRQFTETLRTILNAGYRRGGVASLCTGQGGNIGYRDLSVFCPKCIAGIGKLPDTVNDRSIKIRLKRRSKSEHIDKFRRNKVELLAQPLRENIERMVPLLQLDDAEPELPEELGDRAQDIWEPLLAIADAVGNDWPQRARAAALELSCDNGREEHSLGIRLLADIKAIFEDKRVNQLPTVEIVRLLNAIEEAPWGANDRNPMSAHKLARLLKPYEIEPKNIRQGTTVAKGYIKAEFIDSWSRYLPASSDSLTATSATRATGHPQPETATVDQHEQNVADES